MSRDFASEWFLYADMDLTSAERNTTFYPVHMQLVCYLCQQSAEKYLKGFLVYNGVPEPPRIHNLEKLNALCALYDVRFDEIAEQCEFLTDYGVQPRYPYEMEITEKEMQADVITRSPHELTKND